MKNNQRIVLDLRDCESVRCPACGGEYFGKVYVIKKVPALLSPTAKEEFIVMELFQCLQCGTVLDTGLEEQKGEGN